jgi:hypothetical protein
MIQEEVLMIPRLRDTSKTAEMENSEGIKLYNVTHER